MPSPVSALRALIPRELTLEQQVKVRELVAKWRTRYPDPMPSWRWAGLHAAAHKWVLSGPPPTPAQRNGYRRWKRQRAWEAQFPDIPYPSRGRSNRPTTVAGRAARKAMLQRLERQGKLQS